MINAKAKGKRNERKTKKYLEARGYLVEAVRNTKFHHGDFFGLFDIIAMNEHHIRMVQVKSNRVPSLIIKKILAFTKCPPCVSKEIWSWKDWAKEPKISMLKGRKMLWNWTK